MSDAHWNMLPVLLISFHFNILSTRFGSMDSPRPGPFAVKGMSGLFLFRNLSYKIQYFKQMVKTLIRRWSGSTLFNESPVWLLGDRIFSALRLFFIRKKSQNSKSIVWDGRRTEEETPFYTWIIRDQRLVRVLKSLWQDWLQYLRFILVNE